MWIALNWQWNHWTWTCYRYFHIWLIALSMRKHNYLHYTKIVVLLIAGWNEKLNHLLHCYEDSNWTHKILWNFLNGCHFYGFFLFNRHWKTFIATQVCSGYVSWFWHLAKTMPFIYFILRLIHWTDYIV